MRFFVGDGAFQVLWLDFVTERIVAAQPVDTCIAHCRIEKRPIVVGLALPQPDEAVLHHVFGGVDITIEIVHGIEAERAVVFVESGFDGKHII